MTSKIRNINKYTLNKQMALPLTFKTIKNRENLPEQVKIMQYQGAVSYTHLTLPTKRIV